MLKPLLFLTILIFSIYPVSADIKINEIMYNPTCFSDKYCEWIEIYNDGVNSINISEWTLGDDDANDTLEGSFDDGEGTIIPGYTFALIVDTDTRIYNDFNINESVIWIYTDDDTIGGSKLSNTETITLYDTDLNLIDEVSYNDPVSEGNTFSLINSTFQENSPTPGKDNELNTSPTIDYSVISITEFLPNPEGEDSIGEWVELHNSGSSQLDLLGFTLYDNIGSDSDIIITNTSTSSGTVINSNSYLTIYTNGVSGFLNNDGYERIKLYDIYNNLIDDVTYSESDEAVSWSLTEGEWQRSTPTPGYYNEDNSTSTLSEIRIEEIYDLGPDDKAEWGDIVRVKLYVYKGNTNKNVVWMWLENDEERITKKSKFNLYTKFQNYTFTYPLMIQDNCNNEFLSGNYKIIADGLDERTEEILEIRDKPLCKGFERKASVKSFEYEIDFIPDMVSLDQPFTTEVLLKNNKKEEVTLDIWSFPYSGKKKFIENEEKENLRSLTIKPSEEKKVKLENTINGTEKDELNFKIKIQRADRKTPYELRDKVKIGKSYNPIFNEGNPSKTLKNPITGNVIYENSGQKAKRSAVFFFSGIMGLLLIYTILKHGIRY